MGVQSLPVQRSWLLVFSPASLSSRDHAHTFSSCQRHADFWACVSELMSLLSNVPNCAINNASAESACCVCVIALCFQVLFHSHGVTALGAHMIMFVQFAHIMCAYTNTLLLVGGCFLRLFLTKWLSNRLWSWLGSDCSYPEHLALCPAYK